MLASFRADLTGSKEDVMRSKLAGVVVAVTLSTIGATRAHADVVQDWNVGGYCNNTVQRVRVIVAGPPDHPPADRAR